MHLDQCKILAMPACHFFWRSKFLFVYVSICFQATCSPFNCLLSACFRSYCGSIVVAVMSSHHGKSFCLLWSCIAIPWTNHPATLSVRFHNPYEMGHGGLKPSEHCIHVKHFQAFICFLSLCFSSVYLHLICLSHVILSSLVVLSHVHLMIATSVSLFLALLSSVCPSFCRFICSDVFRRHCSFHIPSSPETPLSSFGHRKVRLR